MPKKPRETDEHLGAETTNTSMSVLGKRQLEEVQRVDEMHADQGTHGSDWGPQYFINPHHPLNNLQHTHTFSYPEVSL